MIIETNKMVNKGLIQEFINNYPLDLEKVFHKITLKKGSNNSKYLICKKQKYELYRYKDKIIVYLNPYHFYKHFNIRDIQYVNNYIKKEDIIFKIYYNIFIYLLNDYLRCLFISIINNYYHKFELGKHYEFYVEIINNYKEYFKQKNNYDLKDYHNSLEIFILKSMFIDISNNNNNIYKHFGAVISFQNKELEQIRKIYKLHKKFSYNLVRYLRCRYTGFKGLYTSMELYNYIFPYKKIISFYSFRKCLNNLYEPIIYKNKKSTKSFKFYNEHHLEEIKLLFKNYTDKIDKEIKKIDMGENENERFQTLFIS